MTMLWQSYPDRLLALQGTENKSSYPVRTAAPRPRLDLPCLALFRLARLISSRLVPPCGFPCDCGIAEFRIRQIYRTYGVYRSNSKPEHAASERRTSIPWASGGTKSSEANAELLLFSNEFVFRKSFVRSLFRSSRPKNEDARCYYSFDTEKIRSPLLRNPPLLRRISPFFLRSSGPKIEEPPSSIFRAENWVEDRRGPVELLKVH